MRKANERKAVGILKTIHYSLIEVINNSVSWLSDSELDLLIEYLCAERLPENTKREDKESCVRKEIGLHLLNK